MLHAKFYQNLFTLKIIMLRPLISIITVVLNDKDNIDKTINSVLNQNYKNIEYIIIDGESKDGTTDIIKRYNKKIDHFVSEKDEGIYHAFNKGLNIAKGDFIGFVNSGDLLTKDSLDYLIKYYNKHPDADFFFGSVKKHWGILHGYKKWKIHFTWGFYSSHSTGFFIKKKAADTLGGYNLKYKYSSDYDYFYRMIVKHKMKGVSTNKKEVVGVFRRGGFSSRINYRKSFYEDLRIRYNNNQNIFIIFIIAIYKFFKHFRKIVS